VGRKRSGDFSAIKPHKMETMLADGSMDEKYPNIFCLPTIFFLLFLARFLLFTIPASTLQEAITVSTDLLLAVIHCTTTESEKDQEMN
jgi:hypothetical protein